MNFVELCRRFQAEHHKDARLVEIRKLSTDDLKALWDAFDDDAKPGFQGYFWPPTEPQIEEVHMILNERGEGDYCAV